jgi:hypothetical protein
MVALFASVRLEPEIHMPPLLLVSTRECHSFGDLQQGRAEKRMMWNFCL